MSGFAPVLSAEGSALRAATGDDEALAVLMRVYHERVFRFGVRVCGSRSDADDAVQEAFIKLSRRPDVVRSGGALAWMMKVTLNTCRRMFRRFALRGARLSAELPQLQGEVDTPERRLERFELVRLVHEAIASLEPPYREVLVLRDIEGMDARSTAEALGLEIAAMKSRLHRARAMLRVRIVKP